MNAAPVRYEAESATVSQGAVESNHTGFSGTGFVNYTNVAGGYVEFTVDAPAAGSATLALGFANGTTGNRPLNISVNGSVAAANLAFQPTGAWTTWSTVTTTVTLKAGTNAVRAAATAAEGGPNLDFIDVTPADGQAGTDYEAESGTISQGAVESNHAGYSGTGFVNFQPVAGASVEFTVDSAQAAAAKLDFRYANGSTASRAMDITVNGTSVADDLAFPATGAWTTWKTVSANAALKAGSNKIRATTSAGDGPNLDKLTVTASGPADTEKPTPPANLRKDKEPTASTVSLAWDPSTDNVKVTGYDIYQHGQLMKSVDGSALAATVEGLNPETSYDWTVFARDAAANVSAASNAVTIATLPAPPDSEAPSVPGNLRSTGKTATSVDLAWNPSTDNVKVTGYDIYRDGAAAGTSDSTSTTIAGLKANTAYTFKVRAFDLKGNKSGFGPEITVTTGGSQPGGVPDPGTVSTLAGGVDVAWGMGFLPDGSGIYTERNTFNVYRLTKSGQKTLIGKVPGVVGTGGEGGLLGIEISPSFTTDHHLYFTHSASEGNRIVRMKYENNALSDYKILLQGMEKSRFHNGGRLRFGPDGKLYASMGDAQSGSRAQDKNSLNGKILRINPDGTVPSDNPFGNAVWSLGHRNPQGLDFDSQGRLWQAEFGNSIMDEVNLIQKGGNYGWPNCEGTSGSCSGYIAPKKTWPTSSASPSGLTIINDHVFVATTVGERVYRLRIDANSNLVEQKTYFQGTYDRLRTVEVDHDGDIWLTTSTDKDGTAGNDRVLLIDIVYSGGSPQPGEFKLTSSAFNDNATIPAKYTCAGDGTAGQDPSPPLAWGAGSSGARSYAIVFADVAGSGNKLHWAIWDIPAARLSLPEGLGSGFDVPGQNGARQKAMGSGANAQKFFGPCPGGSTHPYTFTLYAVNSTTVPGIGSGSSMAQIETAIKNASTANVKLRGNSNAGT
ncbi:PQQ-dependent sugar dehydrogenase [Streptomyces sp. NBC_00885]|uniref:PQQ-dependent sugar dehydrogenase n=1 Tax=Streptomyces sp. NBC_00885 TaxID=2975857 RepID=UPI0038666290|nr:PQQ-dependent sugar dehydrogenase [Streptomyces sp. NBC_00885]